MRALITIMEILLSIEKNRSGSKKWSLKGVSCQTKIYKDLGLVESCKGAFQVVLVVKNTPANVGDIRDVGSITRSGRPPGGGHGNPLQYF